MARQRARTSHTNPSTTLASKIGLIWDFLRVRRKWWLTPVVVVLLLLGLLIVMTQGSAIAPFIYTLF